jgi:hypothetical protein
VLTSSQIFSVFLNQYRCHLIDVCNFRLPNAVHTNLLIANTLLTLNSSTQAHSLFLGGWKGGYESSQCHVIMFDVMKSVNKDGLDTN